MKKNNSIQEWLPFERILKNGIIKLKNNSYIKIIKIYPINFNLKSELEKEAILNSYKIFLKTCDFNFQILIQSKKENLDNHINKIKLNIKNDKNLIQISEQYIKFIKQKNSQKNSSSKNFYIIINYIPEKNQINNKDLIINNLNEKYLKIKDALNRCGNIVDDCSNKDECLNIFFSFLNSKKFLNK